MPIEDILLDTRYDIEVDGKKITIQGLLKVRRRKHNELIDQSTNKSIKIYNKEINPSITLSIYEHFTNQSINSITNQSNEIMNESTAMTISGRRRRRVPMQRLEHPRIRLRRRHIPRPRHPALFHDASSGRSGDDRRKAPDGNPLSCLWSPGAGNNVVFHDGR